MGTEHGYRRPAWRKVALAILCLPVFAGLPLAAARAQAGRQVALPCPPPPKPVRDLDVPRFYANSEGSIVDPEQARRHDAAVAPLVSFLRAIVDDADKAASRRDGARATCALTWLQAWAEGEAWLGDMVTRQAEYQRKWDLAGIALAYVKLKPFATPAQRAAIEPWLLRWSEKARAFFDDPKRTRNNHWYWLGLALQAVSLATGSEKHWQAARDIYDQALADIRPDGTLPKEMERGERALFYHVFAVTPLVVMADLAARRDEDWYSRSEGAVHRLVGLCIKGLQIPAVFDALAQKTQERPVNPRAGWLGLYKSRFPDRVPAGALPTVPDKHRWLGGDVRNLASALAVAPTQR